MRTRDDCCFALIVSLFSWLGLQCVRHCVIVVFPDHTHLFVHTGCNNSDHSGRMPRLIRLYAGRIYHCVGFIMHVNDVLSMTAVNR